MKKRAIRSLLLVPIALFALFYLVGVFSVATDDRSIEAFESPEVPPEVIALFGASGTAGDGILKAALADPDIRKIHVITRRATARIEEGIASGKVQMTRHMDYLDYENIQDQISGVDTVYWAIGISSVGVDEETYGRIHVDFPMQFVREWTAINHNPDLSFHFISSSDISEDSKAMWVREKIRAEKSLFSFADGSNLRVIAYRPDYIAPTTEKAHFGQNLMYRFFRPVGAAVKATEIGRAMLAVSARGSRIENGTKISTSDIVRFSDAYAR
ncbi:MAG: hypothetical protein EVA63_08020 [Halieaceae bacterium]|nr:MAG: hypothetical protein EVA63_08020 [Halieaceae bacterium]